MKKATRSEEQSSQSHGESSTEAPSKIARILAHLLTGASIKPPPSRRNGSGTPARRLIRVTPT